MFQAAGLAVPIDIVETTAIVFITKLLQQNDYIAVVDAEISSYFAEHGLAQRLPIELSCSMDAFGIITRIDRLLSPAANLLLRAIKTTAAKVYGVKLQVAAE